MGTPVLVGLQPDLVPAPAREKKEKSVPLKTRAKSSRPVSLEMLEDDVVVLLSTMLICHIYRNLSD